MHVEMRISRLVPTAILLVLPSIVSAVPIAATLHRRDCPTVETIERWIDDNASVGENTVFYTAGAKQEQARQFSDTLDNGNYWNQVWGNQWLDWLDECGTGAGQDDLFPRMGEALAKKSTGTAYVMMLKGQPLNDFWKNYEDPSLKDRVKITAVNAEDFNDQKDYMDMPFKRAILP